MHLRPIIPCLILAAFILTGCAKQWSNPDIKGKQRSEVEYSHDSTQCDVIAGEQYPLDKRKQQEVHDKCMEDKGWVRDDGTGKAVNFRK